MQTSKRIGHRYSGTRLYKSRIHLLHEETYRMLAGKGSDATAGTSYGERCPCRSMASGARPSARRQTDVILVGGWLVAVIRSGQAEMMESPIDVSWQTVKRVF
jgi:hypothetical protein